MLSLLGDDISPPSLEFPTCEMKIITSFRKTVSITDKRYKDLTQYMVLIPRHFLVRIRLIFFNCYLT